MAWSTHIQIDSGLIVINVASVVQWLGTSNLGMFTKGADRMVRF